MRSRVLDSLAFDHPACAVQTTCEEGDKTKNMVTYIKEFKKNIFIESEPSSTVGMSYEDLLDLSHLDVALLDLVLGCFSAVE